MSGTHQKQSKQYGQWAKPCCAAKSGGRAAAVGRGVGQRRRDPGVAGGALGPGGAGVPAGGRGGAAGLDDDVVGAGAGWLRGGDFGVAGGWVYFSEAGGRLYRQSLAGGPAEPLTPAFGYAASPMVSPDRRWVVFVHTYEDVDCLAIVDAAGQAWPQKLATGRISTCSRAGTRRQTGSPGWSGIIRRCRGRAHCSRWARCVPTTAALPV